MKKYIILICILYFTNCLISKGSGSYTQTDFWLTLSDGVRLDCSKFIPNDNPPAGGYPVAVICHGFGLTKYYEMPTAEKFADSGYYAVVYSMRGQGISEGMSNFISLTEANDLKQLITYIKNDANTNDDKIFVNGGSQGGIVPFMAVCTGLNIKTLITDLASPSAGSNWIENGGIKMTLLWSTSYNNTIVRYNPTVSRFRSWILANTKEKWDSLIYYLPQNRDFINLVENCQIPIFTENAWQDKFFNTYGMIQSAYILPYNNIKMYFGAMDGHGSDYIQEEEDYKDEVLNDWLEYHIDGIQNGVMDASTKFTYVSSKFPVSESKWEWQRNFSPTWPPAGTENIKLYFHPGNTLQVYGYTGNFNEIAYNNDILDPNVSMNYLVNTEFRGPLFEAKFRKNVVNFDTPVLLQNATLAGTPFANLFYSSTAEEMCQINIQIFDVAPNGNEKLVTRINWTDRDYTANQVKQKYINGQSYSHLFAAGHKIRIKLTNLDNVPLYDFNGDTTDTFLRTNPFILPSLKGGTNKIYINNNSRSYIELPLINFVIGIQQISSEIPNSFSLSQNYPNPFNPVTKFIFSVPSTGTNNFVKITIFDMNGKQVSVLANDFFEPGIYETEFNGKYLSSGVYFCRMIAGKFSEIIKMILIK